ncbi:MAG: hypothetical protein CTY19_01620 [Methylomonas sp.]|nr:MAG: hypothetical protein CTY19_01620 [Methylomonas sp.]
MSDALLPPAQPVQHTLSVQNDDCVLQLQVAETVCIREALDQTSLRVRAACGGMGSCGACLIKIVDGQFNPPTLAERQKLMPEDLSEGMRLACQLHARSQGTLYLQHPAPHSQWKSIDLSDVKRQVFCHDSLVQCPYGVAVDLGTTHIRLSLWHRPSGRQIANRIGINPQVAYGADVLTRLDANRLSPQDNQRLQQAARKAVIEGVRDILSRDMGEITPILKQIGKVLIVGNTVMLTLISGEDSNALYDLQNWHQHVACQPQDHDPWRREWRMPNAEIEIVQPLAGFVGSDLLADLLATELTQQPAPALLLDLGTNTEIALWDGKTVWVTSVPGGPAFEGVGMRNGMSSETGAIHKVSKHNDTCSDSWQIFTLGNAAVRGFCASGFIDAVALLLQTQHLKPSGRFAQSQTEHGFRLQHDNRFSAIYASDIDIFQRAKASTAAGMAQLMAFSGLDFSDLNALWICGSLGQHMDLTNAIDVGLLPDIDIHTINRMTHASLLGCEQLLLNPGAGTRLADILQKTKLINLGEVDQYEQLFIDNLRLQPLRPR